MKAQTTIEMLTLLAFFLIVAVILLSTIENAQTTSSVDEVQTKNFFANLPVGVYDAKMGDTYLNFTLVNNLRESVYIHNIYVDSYDLAIETANITSGNARKFNATIPFSRVGDVKNRVRINYSILSSGRLFLIDSGDIRFKIAYSP